MPKTGFTLIEVLTALGIIAVTMLALLSVFPYVARANRASANQTIAAYAAQARMEAMVSQAYDTIATGTIEPKARLASTTDEYLYPFWRETEVAYVDDSLEVAGSDTGLKRVDVTVFWYNPFDSIEQAYALTTLLSER